MHGRVVFSSNLVVCRVVAGNLRFLLRQLRRMDYQTPMSSSDEQMGAQRLVYQGAGRFLPPSSILVPDRPSPVAAGNGCATYFVSLCVLGVISFVLMRVYVFWGVAFSVFRRISKMMILIFCQGKGRGHGGKQTKGCQRYEASPARCCSVRGIVCPPPSPHPAPRTVIFSPSAPRRRCKLA